MHRLRVDAQLVYPAVPALVCAFGIRAAFKLYRSTQSSYTRQACSYSLSGGISLRLDALCRDRIHRTPHPQENANRSVLAAAAKVSAAFLRSFCSDTNAGA